VDHSDFDGIHLAGATRGLDRASLRIASAGDAIASAGDAIDQAGCAGGVVRDRADHRPVVWATEALVADHRRAGDETRTFEAAVDCVTVASDLARALSDPLEASC